MEKQNVQQSVSENSTASSGGNKRIIALGILLVVCVIGLIVVIGLNNSQTAVQEPVGVVPQQPAVVLSSGFATYKEVPVNINPQVPAYVVNKDLSNVINENYFDIFVNHGGFFTENDKALLAQNAFMVKPANYNEFFPLYESNRYNQIPSFVTTDSMLHNYHLMFDFLLKQLEEQKLAGELQQLNANMLAESISQYKALKGTEWENAAKRNMGFFAVGSKLLDSSVVVPTEVADEVNKELILIEQHVGIEDSPVMNIGNKPADIFIETPQGSVPWERFLEDYSQYVPRGHYDKTEQLKGYFKSMMWYGRLTFRVKSDDELKSAMLMTLALDQGKNNNSWNKIYEPVNFFVGKSDDITYYQFKDVIEKVYGKNVTMQAMLKNQQKFDTFVKEMKTLEPPQINSMPIFNVELQPDRDQEVTGFRFMGQRFTIDAAIFQRLITREVGPKGVSCDEAPFAEGRMLPNGLDIPAAMGSKEALNILKADGETQHACYTENMSSMQNYLANLPEKSWVQNLYWGWLYQLRPLLVEKTSGYPSFMQNNAWTRKELNTFLGSWSQLKHDTILYAKQVYAEMGGGGDDTRRDDRGYVEPNPYVYARLASLLQMTNEGLESRGLLTPSMRENLAKMEYLAMSLKTISEKELNNESLTDEEYEIIRSFGGQLEHFWLEVNKDEPEFQQMGANNYLQENPAAIIADVATDPNGHVLEVGTGKISEIYVVVPIDGKLRIAKGGVYSYYEFQWPMSDRLTDKKWRELLSSEQSPNLPSWSNVFTSK